MKLGKGHQPYSKVLQLLSPRTSMRAGAASTSIHCVLGAEPGSSLYELRLLAQTDRVFYPFLRKLRFRRVIHPKLQS